ncbi:hypothetical protein ACQPZZ_36300 [Microbispora sp. CA-135349]|uniref:hypothetical protein n=1 Tax=Microbispora sp. CA-135349 TaxID=3239953 RepID=UPI003D919A57
MRMETAWLENMTVEGRSIAHRARKLKENPYPLAIPESELARVQRRGWDAPISHNAKARTPTEVVVVLYILVLTGTKIELGIGPAG